MNDLSWITTRTIRKDKHRRVVETADGWEVQHLARKPPQRQCDNYGDHVAHNHESDKTGLIWYCQGRGPMSLGALGGASRSATAPFKPPIATTDQ